MAANPASPNHKACFAIDRQLHIIMNMAKSYRATFMKRKKWWVGWSEDVPGAMTQGRTLTEAKANLRDAIRLMKQAVDFDDLPSARIVKARIRL